MISRDYITEILLDDILEFHMEVMVIGIADNTWTYEEAVQWITKHAR